MAFSLSYKITYILGFLFGILQIVGLIALILLIIGGAIMLIIFPSIMLLKMTGVI